MTTLRSTIEDLSTQFAKRIVEALRGASLEELLRVTQQGGERPRVRDTSEPVVTRPQNGRLGRRSESDVAGMVDSIVELLQKNPEGLRSEQIREQLGVEAKELPRPLADAMKKNFITRIGQKRATTYFLASGGVVAFERRGRKPGGSRKP